MKKKKNEKEKKRRRVGWLIVLILLLLILLFFGTITTFITDYWWFSDLGYTGVFFKKLFTELKIGIPLFLILTACSLVCLMTLKKSYLKKLEVRQSVASDLSIRRLTILISGIFSLIMTSYIAGNIWDKALYATNSTGFQKQDPIFGHDVSFYVFKYAFWKEGSRLMITMLAAFLLLIAIYLVYLIYVRYPSILEEKTVYTQEEFEEYQEKKDRKSPVIDLFGGSAFANRNPQRKTRTLDRSALRALGSTAKNHLLILGVLFLLLIGVTFLLNQYELLYSETGAVYGAGYTDTHITIPGYRIEGILSILSAVVLILFARKRKWRRTLVIPGIMIAVLILLSLLGTVVQALVVSPDEISKEKEYLKDNIQFTQEAYGLDEVEEQDFSASGILDAKSIAQNDGTITNIRINDFEPSRQFYNQAQSIRTYYNFNDVDVDRYDIDGIYTQTFLSAREMNSDNLGSDVSWLSKHLKYTHGYGITLSKVAAITSTGQPQMVVDNIPPVSRSEDIQIRRPEIYFGESTNDYIITNTNEQEFDYPSGTENVYSTYESERGIHLNFIRKLFYAYKEQSLKLLVSTNIDKNSKILYDRNILDRVTKIAPFLTYDTDPYIVISDSGQLYWIIDAYTTTPYYPYSQKSRLDDGNFTFNYIRNPIKVTINAYDGSTSFYKVADEPITATLEKIYPDLIRDVSEMPDGLADHIRYSNTFFNIQARIYQRYHMNGVTVFYQNEDRWNISTEVYGQEEKTMVPNYYIMKLPGQESEEFISSIPFTPTGKKNMTGLLVARNDNGHYGELILYRLPKEKVVYGPMQIESQIDQNTEISKEFSLWNSSGSKYTRGDMFVIPIDDSILYVEPVYLESSNDTSLPEVKRVIVAYGDQIEYAPTLSEALDKLFGMGAEYVDANTADDYVGEGNGLDTGTDYTGRGADSTLSLQELAELANQAYDNAVAAQKEGDWTRYGEYLNQLEQYLSLMKADSSVQEPQNESQDGSATESASGNSD